MLIFDIIQGTLHTPQDLYAALSRKGNTDRNKDGGLGKSFLPKTRPDFVRQVFTVADEKHTAKIASIELLYLLAQRFNEGTHGFNRNLNKYAFCLALICQQLNHTHSGEKSVDFRHTKKALDELALLYQEASDLKDRRAFKGKNILELIQLKQKAHDMFVSPTLIPSREVSPGTSFKNSVHIAEFVTVQERKFVKKKDVQARVASFEVFSGTLMELFIGPHQPSTRQEESKGIGSTVAVLSEQINFKPFDELSNFTKWANNRFPDAAILDVANLFMAEDDDHLKNRGLVVAEDSSMHAVRIDFDHTLAPLTIPLNFSGPHTYPKTQRVHGIRDKFPGLGLTILDGFGIHEDNLNHLPLLPILTHKTVFSKEYKKIKDYYLPDNWWAHCDILTSTPLIKKQIANLVNDKRYLKDKFRSILEKIVLPMELVKQIARVTIFNQDDLNATLEWIAERQKLIAAVAPRVDGFLTYLHQRQGRVIAELKIRYENFISKRTDLFPDGVSKLIEGKYDENFNSFMLQLPASLVEERLASSKPVPTASKKAAKESTMDFKEEKNAPLSPRNQIKQFLILMTLYSDPKDTLIIQKQHQLTYFQQEIKKMDLDALRYLSHYMNQVQQGTIHDGAFDVIRTERFFGGGNTRSWQAMRHDVKAHIIDRLGAINVVSGSKILLDRAKFHDYADLLNEHSGRLGTRWGNTSSYNSFLNLFQPTQEVTMGVTPPQTPRDFQELKS